MFLSSHERRGCRLAVILAMTSVIGCGGDSGGESPSRSQLWPQDQWIEQAPEEQGMDGPTLEGARSYAFADGKHTQGVVIVRGGALVAEWYADGSGPESWATSWSVAKSFTSVLIGIAIDEGLIPGVDVSMADYIPEWRGTDTEAITLRDVLTMSSGLGWTEDYTDLGSDVAHLAARVSEPIPFVVGHSLTAQPRTFFNYSSGDTMLLSAVIEAATGMSAAEFAEERLFGPLGFRRAEWWSDIAGHSLTYCCLDSTSRDFARFGLLLLRRGRWSDRQVVSESWVEDSITPSRAYVGYGYQWWLLGRDTPSLPADTYAAIGVDGQYVYVIPSLDLVVVRSGRYTKYDGPAVADPILFALLLSGGLIPTRGTRPPDEWSDEAFLGRIVDSIIDED